MTHGCCGSRTYITWKGIVQRCCNPNQPAYPKYGGAGIGICDRWRHSFENFLVDMGERPEGTSIDRIDGTKGYTPDNCRWATSSQQIRNRRVRIFQDHEPMQIRWLATDGGYNQREIAEAFEVARPNVNRILRGRTWVDES